MRTASLTPILLAGLFGVAACTTAPPPSPTVLAVPGKGRTAQQFAGDDARCRDYAARENGGVSPSQAATNSGLGSAVIGTLLGAGLGAVIGGAAGNPGLGAAAGAGGGLLFGSSVGAGNAERSGAAFQANYDRAYAQCTIASGNQIAQPAVVQYGGPVGYGAYAPVLVGPPPPPVVVVPGPPGAVYAY